MPEDRASLSTTGGLVRLPDIGRMSAMRLRSLVRLAVGLGLMLCAVALTIGLRMALHATPGLCDDGRSFGCSLHRHAGAGTVIAIFSLVLAALLALAGLIADLQLRRNISR